MTKEMWYPVTANIKLGIDTGGTFTDFFLQHNNSITTYKTLSTPDDPSRAIMNGLSHLDIPTDTLEIIHGTTVGTNAFLERKGARTILITTHGFEDVLFIGRQNRQRLYDLNLTRPPVIVPRSHCFGIKERMLWDGTVQLPIGKTVGRRLRKICRDIDARSVAVCLLHSYANPAHEQAVKDHLFRLHLPITLSSEILPEFREYERLTTTLINAYLAPVVSSYINRLTKKLGSVSLSIQQSNGGILPAAGIADRTVHTILSGPAGGVLGAFHVAQETGLQQIITFDMGGTSTDVSLCDGSPSLTRDYRIDSFPIRTQVLDIHTVGAGGGSIAAVDAGGLLRIGPESAGASPGPVCYGKGTKITVTDANLFLGRIPDSLLAGTMTLDNERVTKYMSRLAGVLGMPPRDVARGIIRIVNTEMIKAVRTVSLERGYDPQEFTLFSFGGASGLHCCEMARELGIKKIVIPARSGILSAQGMVFSQPTLDYTHAFFLTGRTLNRQAIKNAFSRLEKRAIAEAEALRLKGTIRIDRRLDLRYKGQSYELTVPFEKKFEDLFHAMHDHDFGYRMKDAELELVSIRCTLRGEQKRAALPRSSYTNNKPQPFKETHVELDSEKTRTVLVYKRPSLHNGQTLQGPALIIDNYTTILLPAGFFLKVDELLNLVITVN